MSKNFDNVQRSEYPTLSARVESDGEPITWDVVINLKYCLLLNRYQKSGYPLGKTKRGLKKWLRGQGLRVLWRRNRRKRR